MTIRCKIVQSDLRKKILIISRAFYPMNSPRSFRTTELVKEFARQGHEVTLLTLKNDEYHIPIEKEFGVTVKDLGSLHFRSIDLSRKNMLYWPKRILKRLLNLLFEYPDIELMYKVKKALKYESGYDLLISIAVPHPIHWGVAWAYDTYGKIAKTWVADCGDPYMGQENDSFNAPFYFSNIEKWFCRKTDYISVPTEGAINGYFPEFHHKIKVIPQGFKFDDVKTKEYNNNKPYPIFAYAGMFIPDRRDPTEFLNYLTRCQNKFQFHIYTKTPDVLDHNVINGDERICVHKSLPRKKLLYELSGMDFMVNFENVGNKQTPSKLIDYHIIEKPILSIKTGELKRDIIDEFLSGEYSNTLLISNPDQYKIENVCLKFLSLKEKFLRTNHILK